ncbi:uncharacterized protein TRIADDRAFT_56474 [Trichoplax adhaerens]|uniref:SRA1/Sec31 domain-containing protein n=1 Tax=Trichoplax adhaerens TaxID=10228 RepID=B3RY87_TRIAD|nr:predicted protein [Trichoplax adhaerens]EDV24556.1 predicted protein [Trichoplax adhaerens]|eukprot:XP_002112446.1 predicted protein [Trichoplax adhaerens]
MSEYGADGSVYYLMLRFFSRCKRQLPDWTHPQAKRINQRTNQPTHDRLENGIPVTIAAQSWFKNKMSERGWNDPPDFLFQNNKPTSDVPRLYRLYGKRQTPSGAIPANNLTTNFLNKDNGPPISVAPPIVHTDKSKENNLADDTSHQSLSSTTSVSLTVDEMTGCLKNMLDKCKESLDVEAIADIEKRLQEMESKWRSNLLSKSTIDALSTIYDAIKDGSNYEKASEVCTALAKNNVEEVIFN